LGIKLAIGAAFNISTNKPITGNGPNNNNIDIDTVITNKKDNSVSVRRSTRMRQQLDKLNIKYLNFSTYLEEGSNEDPDNIRFFTKNN
jgi:hypothetical protein